MEDKESTDTGSLGGISETESPPVSSAAPVLGVNGGHGEFVAPQVTNVTASSLEKSMVLVQQPPPTGGAVVIGGGGSADLTMGKKKRGRPRKYDADGNLRVQYLASPPGSGGFATPPGFSFSSPSSGDFGSSKRGRGRPPGSGNWQLLASLGEIFAKTAGADFTPHVVTVHTGEDVAGKILSLTQKGPRGICILSANGTISNVTIRQPGSSGGLLTYEGRFEILTLTGSFTLSENGGMKSKTGGLSVSLAGPDGRVVGGGVAGVLLAASPIQVVFGSFMPSGYKTHKRKHHTEPRTSPAIPQAEPRMAPVVHSASDSATAATQMPQAAPESSLSQAPTPQFQVKSYGGLDNSTNNMENLNLTSDSVEYNKSGPTLDPRHYPDINVSISME